MSFVTTAPAAIAAAATQLEGVGNSFATESSARRGLDHSHLPRGCR